MSRMIQIELPDSFTVTSAKDAPEHLRTIKTEKWTASTALAAIEFGLSESLGNTWSVGKKNIPTLEARHEALEKGDWARTGNKGIISDAKMKERINKIDVAQLLKMLTPEQHKAILAAGGDISVVTTKG